MFSMSFRRKPESCENVNKDPGVRRDDKVAKQFQFFYHSTTLRN